MRVIRVVVVAFASLLLALAFSGRASAGTIVFTVDTSDGSNDFGCGDGDCSLPDAISAANSLPNFDIKITFDPSIGAIYPADPLSVINATNRSFTIDGSGAGVEILKGAAGVDGLRINGGSSNAIVVKNISVQNFDRAGIYICGGLNGGTCGADLANVTVSDVSVQQNGLTGLAVRGVSTSNVQLTNVNADFNGFAADGPGDGIYVDGSSVSHVALDDGGSAKGASGNAGHGLWVNTNGTAHDISVTGFTAAGNHNDGVLLQTTGGSMFNVAVQGVASYSNQQDGIDVDGSAGLSATTIAGSNVHDNSAQGIHVRGGLGMSATVSGNQINTNGHGALLESDGQIALTTFENNTVTNNTGYGLRFSAGGGGADNLIHGNTFNDNEDAIYLDRSSVTKISHNITHSNRGLGINLADVSDPANGVTPNDVGDGDTGPNGLLNFPVFNGATTNAVIGTACANCVVEVFQSDGDPSNHGEGQTFLNSATADGQGNVTVSLCGDVPVSYDSPLTATATDSQGNTSEFSQNYELLNGSINCPSTTPTASPTHTPTLTPASPSPTPTLAPGQHRQGDLNCDTHIDGADGLLALTVSAGIPQPVGGACPPVGAGNPKFGDVNCDGAVDEHDAVAILTFAAGARPLPQHEPCTNVGAIL